MAYGLVHAFRFLAMAIVALVHRRHLMVWSVFAPRLIFDAGVLLMAHVGILLALVCVGPRVMGGALMPWAMVGVCVS